MEAVVYVGLLPLSYHTHLLWASAGPRNMTMTMQGNLA